MKKHLLPKIQSRIYLWCICLFLSIPIYSQDIHRVISLSEKNGFPSGSISSILEDELGYFWMNVDSALVRYDGYRTKIYNYPFGTSGYTSGNRSYPIAQFGKGSIWIGGNGIGRFDLGTELFEHYSLSLDSHEEVDMPKVLSIQECRRAYLWLGTKQRGLYRFDPRSGIFLNYKLPGRGKEGDAQPSGISVLTEDRLGGLWLAKENGEVYIFDPVRENFQYLEGQNASGKESAAVVSIVEDAAGYIWVVTTRALRQYNLQGQLQATHFFASEVAKPITAALMDAQGEQLWLSTVQGVSCFQLTSKSWRHFPVFKKWLEEPSVTLMQSKRTGLLFLGTDQTLVVFKPAETNLSDRQPSLVFSGIWCFDPRQRALLPIEFSPDVQQNPLVIGHKNKILTFEFAWLNFRSSSENRYAYQLEGFLKEWISLGHEAKVTFSNLAPGSYTLRVKAIDDNGEVENTLKFIVKPQWWQSWHAYFMYIVAFLVFLYYTRYRELARQHKKLVREKQHNEWLRQMNQAMGKFVPNEFLRSLGRNRITEVALGDHAERTVTVLFSDIWNYTSLAEQMTPEQNYNFVNAFLGRMGPIIQQHGGFVNQYLGDAIMAIFPSSPADALRAAVDMQSALRTYNESREVKGRCPLRIGIGMHTGSIVMGIIGDGNRFDAAIISDTVNTASRIESLTRYYDASILLSEESIRQMRLGNDLKVRYLGRVQVKGKQEHLGIFECLCGESSEGKEKKVASLTDFEAGMKNFISKDFPKAARAFKSVLQANPEDQVARQFLRRAVHFIRNGVPQGWNGVEMMECK